MTDAVQQRELAARVFIVFGVLFFAGFISGGYVLASVNGRGSGFGDGYLVPSCYTPGGPYYVDHLPVEEQQCPHGVSSPLKNKDMGAPGRFPVGERREGGR